MTLNGVMAVILRRSRLSQGTQAQQIFQLLPSGAVPSHRYRRTNDHRIMSRAPDHPQRIFLQKVNGREMAVTTQREEEDNDNIEDDDITVPRQPQVTQQQQPERRYRQSTRRPPNRLVTLLFDFAA